MRALKVLFLVLAFSAGSPSSSWGAPSRANLLAVINDPLLKSFEKEKQRAKPTLESIDPSAESGSSTAVVVDDAALVHTSQILPLDLGGTLKATDLPAQIEQVLTNLDRTLKSAGAALSRAVKLNVYLKRAEDLPAVRQALAGRYRSPHKPAASYVVGDLPEAGARVAMDAIAPVDETAATAAMGAYPQQGWAPAAVLPAGAKLFVSGMADTNELRQATRKTLEKLIAAIGHLGLDRTHIIQLKSFLQPMTEVAVARKEIVDFFEGKAPPLVFVEWISPAPNPPIEIELIATVPGEVRGETDSVSFLTPPGTGGSKVYSRVARVNPGKLIYFSGLYGLGGESGAAQIRAIFEGMKKTLARCGSDLEHLAKATYYVSDDEASNQLNLIRPEFYNPQRPPAASKARVKSVGLPGTTVTLDMIAVPKP